jgi:hypothetical protein
MPESFIVAVHAGLVGPLDWLTAIDIDAKLDQPAGTNAAAGDRVITARTVASFAAAPLEIVARLNLKQLAHFGLGEFPGEVAMTRVAINAADIFGLCEVSEIRIGIGGVGINLVKKTYRTQEREREDDA